ncbi:hypothetical protein FRZ03_08135 [Streptomyces misionensis]|uniref:DUF2269 family protein n=1 Tax=Streptomyces misionensis TaxID=67331 RepID=A0A5C6JYX5_9ACTN|nr:hypothetical protein [Streptomyces misionensis]TWV53924.1 hypothetical protein FRZ03_08135 [Streptomyces misionensis]
MTKLFLCLHVLAAVVAVGPVTVAASMFPPALRRAHQAPGDRDALGTLRLLHRICRVYAAVGAAVPVLGFATAGVMGVMGSAWLIASTVLTAAAAAVLALLLLPAQSGELDALQDGTPGPVLRAPARLAMLTGLFNLLWATVTVLMIVRPGSTTGA